MNPRQLFASAFIFSAMSPFLAFGGDDALVLHDATPVRLRLTRNLSSADATVGETVDFEVLDDVKIGGTLIVARGGTAIATVTQAQKKRRMARGGKLDVNIDYVRAVNGDKLALRAVRQTSSGGHTGAMTGAIVATSLVFFPAAPFFLFMHGKDITIPKGTELTAYSNGDIKLEPAKFNAKQGTPPATAAVVFNQAPSVAPKPLENVPNAQLAITSEPNGAEIEINGEFIGSTPTTVRVKEGVLVLKLKKNGFLLWERTLTLNAGDKRSVSAEMVNSNLVKLPR